MTADRTSAPEASEHRSLLRHGRVAVEVVIRDGVTAEGEEASHPAGAESVVAGSSSLAPREPKKSVTVQMRTSLVLQSHTAVLRTAALAGGPRSFAAFVESAITRELARLAEEFNGGVPFEMLEGEFRTGRPFGS